MSTTRSRGKDDSEKAASARRSARSTDTKESKYAASPEKENSKENAMVLYQCNQCNNILSNSNFLIKIVQMDENMLIFPLNTGDLPLSDEVFLATENEYDQFCAYKLVLCSKCRAPLGRHYLSTTEKMSEAKGVLIIRESSLVIYDIKTAKTTTPSNKKKNKVEESTSKKVVVTTVKKSTENKEPPKQRISPQLSPIRPEENTRANHSPVLPEFTSERQTRKQKEENVEDIGDKDEQQIRQVDDSFREMKDILTKFAELLGQFDSRLTASEGTIGLVNQMLSKVFRQLDVQEVIDLS